MQIGTREIGPDHPPLVICEIGISHMGSVDAARRTIDDCWSAGAECVKLQHHIAGEEMTDDHPWWDTIVECSLTIEQLAELKAHAESRDMLWLCTPFSVRAAQELRAIGVNAWKIGSGEVTHNPLIDYVASTRLPVLMSTGMHSITEIARAVRVIGGSDACLLHCVGEYPCPPESANLCRLEDLFRNFYGVGYSDHTAGITVPIVAAGLGACVIEKHVGRDSRSPDACVEIHPSSPLLRDLLQGCDDAWLATREAEPRDEGLRRLARHDRRDDWRRAP